MATTILVRAADDYKKGAWLVLRNGRVFLFNGEHPERDARAFAKELRKP